ncbi:hypothetical protein D3C72_1422320 [compost metagenome]
MKASWISPKAWLSCPATAPPLWSARVRSAKGLSVTNTMPALELLVKPLIDRPGKAIASSTFGFFLTISPMRRITLSVRSSVAPSGSCAKPTRYCLSCIGTKPPGTRWNRPQVAPTSARYTASMPALCPITRRTPPL